MPNNTFSLPSTSFCFEAGNCPSSRIMILDATVIIRCNCKAEETRSPIEGKSLSVSLNTRSVESGFSGTRLVMNAKITCLCSPMGSVRQTAGRTFVLERSSNGKGTSTTLCFIERFSIADGVNVFFGVVQVFKGGVAVRMLSTTLFRSSRR